MVDERGNFLTIGIVKSLPCRRGLSLKLHSLDDGKRKDFTTWHMVKTMCAMVFAPDGFTRWERVKRFSVYERMVNMDQKLIEKSNMLIPQKRANKADRRKE